MATDRDLRPDPIPEGLLEALAGVTPEDGSDRMATARRHAESRSFDEPMVVQAIASELLAMSGAQTAASAY